MENIRKRFHLDVVVRSVLDVPRWIGENPFLGFLILLLLALLISSFVFYRYVISARGQETKIEIVQTRFDKQAFERLLQTWQEHEKKFQEAETIRPRNIFVPSQGSEGRSN